MAPSKEDQRIRVTDEFNRRLAVLDVIAVMGFQDPKREWQRVQERHPSLVASAYSFGGRGRPTPVLGEEQLLELLIALESSKAEAFREWAAGLQTQTPQEPHAKDERQVEVDLTELNAGASGRTTCVYALCDPDSRRVGYVGKALDPEDRLRLHREEALAGAAGQKSKWLRSLLAQGKNPLLIILAEVSDTSWQGLERQWISLLRDSLVPLTNQRPGGEGKDGSTPPGAFDYLALKEPEETKAVAFALLTGDWAKALATSTAEQAMFWVVSLEKTPPPRGLEALADRARAGLSRALQYLHPARLDEALLAP